MVGDFVPMIFSIGRHIELIKQGLKTQTRRQSGKYQVGQLYSIQPSRTSKAIPDGKILIVAKRRERSGRDSPINIYDAAEEGGYSPDEFESLYEKMHHSWAERWVYTFRFVPLPTKYGTKE